MCYSLQHCNPNRIFDHPVKLGGIVLKSDRLAICDQDEKYMEKLQQYLISRSSFPFSVSIYGNMGEFQKENAKKEFEVILAGESMFQNLAEKKFSGMIVLLQDKGIVVSKAERVIRKYQSAEIIRKKILELYADWNGTLKAHGIAQKDSSLIGVYSPLGRCIQTSFSLLLGQFLAKKQKVLYLNFEPFSGLSGLLGREEENDLTDLVYYLSNGKERFLYKLESMVSNVNGLNYVAPAYSYMDIAAVKSEDWLLLIQSLKECTDYDVIILDLSELVQGLPDVLRECSYIYTLNRTDGVACHKMKEYEDLLERQEYQDIISKTKKLEFPIFKSLPATLEEMSYGELADYVKKIAAASA